MPIIIEIMSTMPTAYCTTNQLTLTFLDPKYQLRSKYRWALWITISDWTWYRNIRYWTEEGGVRNYVTCVGGLHLLPVAESRIFECPCPRRHGHVFIQSEHENEHGLGHGYRRTLTWTYLKYKKNSWYRIQVCSDICKVGPMSELTKRSTACLVRYRNMISLIWQYFLRYKN